MVLFGLVGFFVLVFLFWLFVGFGFLTDSHEPLSGTSNSDITGKLLKGVT